MTLRSVVAAGSVAAGFTAPTASAIALRYSTPDCPGHCPEGSAEVFVYGLPRVPLLMTFIWTLPTLSTAPGPNRSGTARGVDVRQLRDVAPACVTAVAESS